MLETRTAGDQQQVSEVTRQGDYKFLYRLRVDENTLRRRNVTATPNGVHAKNHDAGKDSGRSTYATFQQASDSAQKQDAFQTEFDNEKSDSSQLGKVFEANEIGEEPVLKKAKLFEYRPRKFFNDYVVAGLNNTAFAVNKFQPYAGGAGPIEPSNGNDLNGLMRMGTVDLFEDIKISGGIPYCSKPKRQ